MANNPLEQWLRNTNNWDAEFHQHVVADETYDCDLLGHDVIDGVCMICDTKVVEDPEEEADKRREDNELF